MVLKIHSELNLDETCLSCLDKQVYSLKSKANPTKNGQTNILTPSSQPGSYGSVATLNRCGYPQADTNT